MSYLQHFIDTIHGSKNGYLILDTETTGLADGEVCQIAVINQDEKIILNTLVKTVNPIPRNATIGHGIVDDDVADSPGWSLITKDLQVLLKDRIVIIYNAVYDRKMMHQSAEKAGLPKYDWKAHSTFLCAMEAFAEFYGDWNEYHQSYRWQKLSVAAGGFGYKPENFHNALADCQATLFVVKSLLAEISPSSNGLVE